MLHHIQNPKHLGFTYKTMALFVLSILILKNSGVFFILDSYIKAKLIQDLQLKSL